MSSTESSITCVQIWLAIAWHCDLPKGNYMPIVLTIPYSAQLTLATCVKSHYQTLKGNCIHILLTVSYWNYLCETSEEFTSCWWNITQKPAHLLYIEHLASIVSFCENQLSNRAEEGDLNLLHAWLLILGYSGVYQ